MSAFTPRDPDWEQRIRKVFALQGMMGHLGIAIESLAPGIAVLTAPIRPEISQQHGFAHAGLAFSAGDTAAGIAAQSLMAPGFGVLTIEMKINLLAPARGQAIRATGRVERAGRTVTVVRSDVVALDQAGAETPIATMLGTMAVMGGMD
ncbi:uncharacterized domain 1-containing protein [Albimonas donghaensis]|uniref:Medium/long-chain acyl-CoA thioesterase YigI n=1 Tax=Albimonas donghaensis TaxID=356660 RepID=A0A1H2WNG6_9RHOB|nr:PaaI family thioesterase [Albimonas donghaensis]SDW81539.1 uncharacterized domain 1-containing protein [Albimonas donghaensis]